MRPRISCATLACSYKPGDPVVHLRARCPHAVTCIQCDRRSPAALGGIRRLCYRLDGGGHRPHSRWPGDIRSCIGRHAKFARCVGRSGTSRSAPTAGTDLLAPDAARHLAYPSRDQTRLAGVAAARYLGFSPPSAFNVGPIQCRRSL